MIKAVINPDTLICREDVQNRVDEVAARFAGGKYPPIVAVEMVILDGHNRALVATERGDSVTVVDMTQDEYDLLADLGYDDMEISYAALTAAEEVDAALAYVDQFAGSNIFERGEEAYNKLMEVLGDEQN